MQFLRMLAAYLDTKVWDRPDLVGRAGRQAVAEEAARRPTWLHNIGSEGLSTPATPTAAWRKTSSTSARPMR